MILLYWASLTSCSQRKLHPGSSQHSESHPDTGEAEGETAVSSASTVARAPEEPNRANAPVGDQTKREKHAFYSRRNYYKTKANFENLRAQSYDLRIEREELEVENTRLTRLLDNALRTIGSRKHDGATSAPSVANLARQLQPGIFQPSAGAAIQPHLLANTLPWQQQAAIPSTRYTPESDFNIHLQRVAASQSLYPQNFIPLQGSNVSSMTAMPGQLNWPQWNLWSHQLASMTGAQLTVNPLNITAALASGSSTLGNVPPGTSPLTAPNTVLPRSFVHPPTLPGTPFASAANNPSTQMVLPAPGVPPIQSQIFAATQHDALASAFGAVPPENLGLPPGPSHPEKPTKDDDADAEVSVALPISEELDKDESLTEEQHRQHLLNLADLGDPKSKSTRRPEGDGKT